MMTGVQMGGFDEEVEAGGVVRLVLALEPDPEFDAEAGERLVRQLRTELAELDVEAITLATTETSGQCEGRGPRRPACPGWSL
jgi:hypothetical protein